jgi:hypothetical protein
VWFTDCAAIANTLTVDDRSFFGAYYQFNAVRPLNFCKRAKGRAKGFFWHIFLGQVLSKNALAQFPVLLWSHFGPVTFRGTVEIEMSDKTLQDVHFAAKRIEWLA